ncbi:MAG: ATP-binding cassette domain-containing protein [Bacilli bacterium]
MIILENVSKEYNEKKIINSFNYNVKKGDYTYITGKSGTGKSTLLYLISKLEKPSSGKVVYEEEIKIGFDFKTTHY